MARFVLFLLLLVSAWPGSLGCVNRRGEVSPVAGGLNTRDLYDIPAQANADREFEPLLHSGLMSRMRQRGPTTSNGRSALCLSGGGSYGAYSAGVICGWTCRGDRPCFDVVTGISTGALIAPFAFLGSSYDAELETFYTTMRTSDVYRLRPVRGLFTEALADNTPLARKLDKAITTEMVDAIAIEHSRGRRLYVGTTEVEGRRFVAWDIGAIACRGTPETRDLIVQILLGSSAIPGFFPSQHIPVTVDGRRYVERHVDGGVSQALFFRPPYVPPGQTRVEDALKGTNVYAVVAGKLYADAEVIKPRALTVATQTSSTVLYAQCRGDLMRLWTVCQMTGMNYQMTAIPAEYPAPKTSTDFDPSTLRGMFDEGVRQIRGGSWRMSPPGTEPGEEMLVREGTELIEQPRVPIQNRR
jgi:hypothetical protein